MVKENKNITSRSTSRSRTKSISNENKTQNRKMKKTSIKKKKALSLNNTKNKKQNVRKCKSAKALKQTGGDGDICERNLNDLLTRNKAVFTYNRPDDQYKKMLSNSSNLKAIDKGWGNNPGTPPDPSSCVIL